MHTTALSSGQDSKFQFHNWQGFFFHVQTTSELFEVKFIGTIWQSTRIKGTSQVKLRHLLQKKDHLLEALLLFLNLRMLSVIQVGSTTPFTPVLGNETETTWMSWFHCCLIAHAHKVTSSSTGISDTRRCYVYIHEGTVHFKCKFPGKPDAVI